MKLIFVLAALASFFGSAQAQQLPAEQQPDNQLSAYETAQVRQKCLAESPFMVNITSITKDGVVHQLGTVACLSAKDSKLITLACDRVKDTCLVADTKEERKSPMLEEILRRAKADGKKGPI